MRKTSALSRVLTELALLLGIPEEKSEAFTEGILALGEKLRAESGGRQRKDAQ